MMLKVYDLLRSLGWYIISFIYDLIDGLLKIIKQLSKEGRTIIFSTHDPNHALVLDCDVCIIHNRKVFCNGKASEILSKDVITDIYGTETCIYENAGRKYCEITFE